MTWGVIFATEGFEESHLVYAHHRLREDGTLVAFATPEQSSVRGRRGMEIRHSGDVVYDGGRRPDFVIVPGSDDVERPLPPEVATWFDSLAAGPTVLACIGGSVPLLIDLELVADRVIAGPDHLRETIDAHGGHMTEARVTVDGNLVTATGTEALPFFLVAIRNALAIPQDPDAAIRRRPYQERATWEVATDADRR